MTATENESTLLARKRVRAYPVNWFGWCLVLLWTSMAVRETPAAGDANELARLREIRVATSNKLASLPLRAYRAERLFKAAESDKASVLEAQAHAARVLRLAAKETRDAYYDVALALTRTKPAFGRDDFRAEWDALAQQGEAARERDDFEAALDAYAEALKRMLAVARLPDKDIQATDTPAQNDAAMAEPSATTLPKDAAYPTDGCPEPVARLIEQALADMRKPATLSGSANSVSKACQAVERHLPRLSGKPAQACIAHVARLAPSMTPIQARRLLATASEAGLDSKALSRDDAKAAWQALRARSVPAGFEIVADPPPPLPVKQEGATHGFVFETSRDRAWFEALPRIIRTSEGFFPARNVRAMTFLLVPSGTLFFPDDEGRVHTLRNARPFYLGSEETRWGVAAALHADSMETQRKAPAWNPSALRALSGGDASVLNAPVRFACGNMIADLCRWLNRLAATAAGVSKDNVAEDVFVPTSVAGWRFAACLDLLVRAEQDGVRPSYRWWRRLRAKRGWDAAVVKTAPSDPPGGWGFHHLFGNVAERATAAVADAAARRCGGSYRESATPILGFPFYNREAEDGEDDLGFRLTFVPSLGSEPDSAEISQP